MRQLLVSALAAAAICVLSACSTSGLMTPPEPIGDPSAKTATTHKGAPPALDSPEQTSLAAEENRDIGTQQTQFPQTATTAGDDQQPKPQQTGPRSPMLGTPGGVSATQKSIYQASGQPQAPGVLGTLPAGEGSVAGGSIRFLPIIGAPISAVTPLSRELATNASARGLSIKPSSDNSTEHMLKGYFSAFDDGAGTTITYVWDVLDASGARLTRLQGQEKLAGKSADPWANVPPNVMSKIASDTINQYIAWKSSRRG
ncbi:hypothetical protein [Rhizobium sp. C4]|uniref:hypothetical protein n=1 Tax=Rhizobium sp. C4 TaxID=1349800 RepID=UPI001E3FEB53|nr:hypothetical protein [Rhizobium sp. C4]MCD2173708.1 hypothetical protein [Rhizobium sp. C4]